MYTGVKEKDIVRKEKCFYFIKALSLPMGVQASTENPIPGVKEKLLIRTESSLGISKAPSGIFQFSHF